MAFSNHKSEEGEGKKTEEPISLWYQVKMWYHFMLSFRQSCDPWDGFRSHHQNLIQEQDEMSSQLSVSPEDTIGWLLSHHQIKPALENGVWPRTAEDTRHKGNIHEHLSGNTD